MPRLIDRLMMNVPFRRSSSIFRRNRLTNRDFTIISNNCWGGSVYRYLGLPYNSPFVGMFMFAPDYVEMLGDLKHYLCLDLDISHRSRYVPRDYIPYPIGLLGDLELHFLHYDDNSEVLDKWHRRIDRINWDSLYIKFSDRDLCTYEIIERFDSLPYHNKVCFTSKPCPEFKSCINIGTDDESSYKRYFDVIGWLDGELP